MANREVEVDMRDRVRQNYKVTLTCVDCQAEFDVLKIDQTLERVGPDGNVRDILMWVPAECPECHNLRVVG